MSFFKKHSKKKNALPINDHALRKVSYTIDNAPNAPTGKWERICEPIGETSKYYLYNCYVGTEHKEGEVLRKSKSNPSDIKVITVMWKYWSVFHGYFFQCEHSGLQDRFFVWGYNIDTGLMEPFFWFGDASVFAISEDGHITGICQDYVKAMYVKDDELIIEVHRLSAGKYNKIVEGKTNCLIKVKYEDGKFIANDIEL